MVINGCAFTNKLKMIINKSMSKFIFYNNSDGLIHTDIIFTKEYIADLVSAGLKFSRLSVTKLSGQQGGTQSAKFPNTVN